MVKFCYHETTTTVSQLELSIIVSHIKNSTIRNALTVPRNHVRFASATGMAEPGAACSSHEAHLVGFVDTSSENYGERLGELMGTYVNV